MWQKHDPKKGAQLHADRQNTEFGAVRTTREQRETVQAQGATHCLCAIRICAAVCAQALMRRVLSSGRACSNRCWWMQHTACIAWGTSSQLSTPPRIIVSYLPHRSVYPTPPRPAAPHPRSPPAQARTKCISPQYSNRGVCTPPMHHNNVRIRLLLAYMSRLSAKPHRAASHSTSPSCPHRAQHYGA